MTRRTQPVETVRGAVELAGRIQADVNALTADAAPSLPVLCDDAGRAARAIAGRVERAAADLAGPSNVGGTLALGHQDVWRFEADARRAARDLLDLANGVANWRRTRDAEIQADT